jgi:hypothetical protein
MVSRYRLVQEAMVLNTKYAKINNINIIILLFDTTVRIYTNMTISDESKSKIPSGHTFIDNLSYDEIITYINKSRPMGGTDFLIPFQIFELISEFNSSSIFFLSDGCNNKPLTTENNDYLNKFKNRITTLGIGKKQNFDHITLAKMSSTDTVIEGDSSEVIQNELLAKMSDATTHEIDTWVNVEIVIAGHQDDLKIGTMMIPELITEENFNKINVTPNTNNPNLVIEKYNNNFIIKKKNIHVPKDKVTLTVDTICFFGDQSGSMESSGDSTDESVSNIYNIHGLLDTIDENETNLSEDNINTHIIYRLKISNMKHYQRILMTCSNPDKIKAYISWDSIDKTLGKFERKTMIINDSSRWTLIANEKINKIISVTNEIGHCINISNVNDKHDRIGNFRKIKKIFELNKDIFTLLDTEPIDDCSLTELLFFNKNHGMKLYNSTLTHGQRNVDHLLYSASSGGGRAVSAAVTMSASSSQTPSQQYHYEEDENRNHMDISMCSICFSEIRQYLFSCGHCYACHECAEKLLISEPMNSCSYCKKTVTWIRKITMTDDQKNSNHYFKCIAEDCYNIASIVTKCKPISYENPDLNPDQGYHLTYCNKCFKGMKNNKKCKKMRQCFCGEIITIIQENIYFN